MTEKNNVVAFEPKGEAREEAMVNPNKMPAPVTPLTILTEKLGITPETVAKLEAADKAVLALESVIDTAMTSYVEENYKESHERDISIPIEALVRTLGGITKEMDQLIPESELANFEHHANVRMKMSEAINAAMIQVSDEIDGQVYAQDLYLSLIIVLSSHVSQHRIHSFHKIFDQGYDNGFRKQEDNVSDETDNI